ncbi:MAG: NDP-sugar synthase [Candidatus Thorarchaeota archaeon]
MTDTIESIMNELKSRINIEDEKTIVTAEEIQKQIPKTAVVLPAGGKGERIRADTQSERINKVMISIDGKESMIEKVVREYSEIGITNFTVLTGFLADVVEEHLGNGSKWGVEIKYSRDPDGKKVGNAGAILHALNHGVIDDTKDCIIHNPDDLIIGTGRPYGEIFVEGFLKAKKNECLGTFVVVPESPFQYSGLIIQNGKVIDVTKYPLITIPAHTGITVFASEVFDYFREYVSLEIESSFENVICPILAKEGRLFAINIPTGTWIPVNDLKGIEQAKRALEMIL